MNNKTIYQFKALQFSGIEKSLSDFDGKVLLIVNTASRCFFRRQFKSLEFIYQKYKDQGFEILAFPSHSFGNQEPRTGHNLETYCRIQARISFPIFKRIYVKGTYIHPLYAFLSDSRQNGHVDSKPVWNFHKYLINRKGEVVDYYYPFTSPKSPALMSKIEELLKQ